MADSSITEEFMEDNRKAKIKELKANIEQANQELQKMKEEGEGASPKERREFQESLLNLYKVIQAMAEELKTTTLNRLSSPSFSFEPTPPNRRYRRSRGRYLLRMAKKRGINWGRDEGNNNT